MTWQKFIDIFIFVVWNLSFLCSLDLDYSKKVMASPSSSLKTRIWFRTVILISLTVVLFYVGRPLYWKISATIHDIRHNKQSVREGKTQSLSISRWILQLSRCDVFFGYRYIADRTRSAEIGRMVSRRVRFRVPGRSPQEIRSRRI